MSRKFFTSLAEVVTLIFKSGTRSITLQPSSTAAYSADRIVELPASDSAAILVARDSVDTMSNKTISATAVGGAVNDGTLGFLKFKHQTADAPKPTTSSGDVNVYAISNVLYSATDNVGVKVVSQIPTVALVAPSGVIMAYGGASAPYGWLDCDGSAYPRTGAFAGLFAALGTAYGVGDGSTTFNIPDMRGVFLKGAGTTNRAAGKDAAGSFYAGTRGTYSTDKMQGHKHTDSGHTHVLPFRVGNTTGSSSVVPQYSYSADSSTNSGAANLGDPTTNANGTPRVGATTEPQSVGVNYIIKV